MTTKIKWFADVDNWDYYLFPTIAIDFGWMYNSHKIFMLSFRLWKWDAGFTIFYKFKQQTEKGLYRAE